LESPKKLYRRKLRLREGINSKQQHPAAKHYKVFLEFLEPFSEEKGSKRILKAEP
jgi:hypothetical protein